MEMVQPSGCMVYLYRGGIPPLSHAAERHADDAACGFKWNPDRDEGLRDVAWLARGEMCRECLEWADSLLEDR